ncbi:MAG: Autotransporter beta-domain protein [Candidatus Omnitrophica bacterium ADurb.Bin277]|nr:MAG: Autotransporter beta-domain protein [Candidatus Omnitrophica bacterium ADurb.Bin277]
MKKIFSVIAILSFVFSPVTPAFAENDLGGTGIWVQGLAGQDNQRENKGYKAFQDNIMDYTVGFDKIVNRHTRLGANFGYGYSNKNFKQNQTGYGSYGINDHSFATVLTATYDSIDLCESRARGKYSPEAVRNQGIDGWYVDSALGFTQHNYDLRTERYDLALAPNLEVGKSDFHAQEYALGTEAGYIFNMGEDNSIHITPFTELNYNYLYRNTARVKGLGANDYKIKDGGATDLEQGFGVQIAKSLVSEKLGTFIPYVKGEWLIAYIRDIQSHNRQRNTGLFGAGLIFLNKGHMTFSANWEMLMQNRDLENVGYGKIRYDF